MRSLFKDLSRTPRSGPSCHVRAFEVERLHGLNVSVPSTTDPKLIVWVTAFLGSQLFCREGFIGTTMQDETIETSAGTTRGVHAGRNPLLEEARKPFALGRARHNFGI